MNLKFVGFDGQLAGFFQDVFYSIINSNKNNSVDNPDFHWEILNSFGEKRQNIREEYFNLIDKTKEIEKYFNQCLNELNILKVDFQEKRELDRLLQILLDGSSSSFCFWTVSKNFNVRNDFCTSDNNLYGSVIVYASLVVSTATSRLRGSNNSSSQEPAILIC